MQKFIAAILLCVFASVSSNKVYDGSQHLPIRSCNPKTGVVCLPEACSNASCALFPGAKCISDRCGCEARFFSFINNRISTKDVTKMCKAATGTLSFLQFMEIENVTLQDETAADPHRVLNFFLDFDLLLTSIAKDLVAYLRALSIKTPSSELSAKYQQAVGWMHQLEEAEKNITATRHLGEPVIDKRIFPFLLGLLPSTIKLGANLVKNLVNSKSDEFQDAQDDMGVILSGHFLLTNPGTKDVLLKILDMVKSMAKNSALPIGEATEEAGLTTKKPFLTTTMKNEGEGSTTNKPLLTTTMKNEGEGSTTNKPLLTTTMKNEGEGSTTVEPEETTTMKRRMGMRKAGKKTDDGFITISITGADV